MRWDDFRRSENVEDRRGMGSPRIGGTRRAGGGLGLGGLVILLVIAWVTGINPLSLIGGLDTGPDPSPPVAQRGEAGTPGDEIGQFVSGVLGETEVTWGDIFRSDLGAGYREPRLVLFTGGTRSDCGIAQSAMGPFYCPLDATVYLDTAFFDEMKTRFRACPAGEGACEFAQAYVIAHEVGHHVQNLLGILPKVQEVKRRLSERDANALSVRTELQADCFAGVWAANTEARKQFLTEGDVEAAMQTASAIGDDMLQRRTQGYVVPDSFTHGSSEQRQRWFMKGLRSGSIEACDTFSARDP